MAEATREHPRLKQRYDAELRPQLQRELGLRNVMEVPRLEKIVLNCGVGLATQTPALLDGAVTDLGVIAGFKLREGNPIGAKVTLRGARMWEFYDRLVSLAIPRIRDFRGMNPRAFDGRGNYTFGVTEQLIFPEIDYDKIDAVRGMDITIVTTARNDDEGRARLAVPSPERKPGVTIGEESIDPEAATEAEVQGAGLHALSPMWPGARCVSPLWAVPHLPARHGAQRRGPGRRQGVLVRR